MYLLFLIIPVLIFVFILIYCNYKNKKNRIVIPTNDIEMGDSISVKTEETVISEINKENPYKVIKEVIEFLIIETEKIK